MANRSWYCRPQSPLSNFHPLLHYNLTPYVDFPGFLSTFQDYPPWLASSYVVSKASRKKLGHTGHRTPISCLATCSTAFYQLQHPHIIHTTLNSKSDMIIVLWLWIYYFFVIHNDHTKTYFTIAFVSKMLLMNNYCFLITLHICRSNLQFKSHTHPYIQTLALYIFRYKAALMATDQVVQQTQLSSPQRTIFSISKALGGLTFVPHLFSIVPIQHP